MTLSLLMRPSVLANRDYDAKASHYTCKCNLKAFFQQGLIIFHFFKSKGLCGILGEGEWAD